MGAAAERRRWVKDVLGFDLPPELDAKRLEVAIASYHNTLAEVGNGVVALQAKLRGTGNPLLKRIADEGLTDLTGGFRVTMSTALMELLTGSANQRSRNAKVASKLCGKIAGFVAENDLFTLLDANPYQVPVNSKARLGRALQTLDAEITACLD